MKYRLVYSLPYQSIINHVEYLSRIAMWSGVLLLLHHQHCYLLFCSSASMGSFVCCANGKVEIITNRNRVDTNIELDYYLTITDFALY